MAVRDKADILGAHVDIVNVEQSMQIIKQLSKKEYPHIL